MTKNVTLRLDENILHKARHQAVEQKKSLSQWLADLIASKITVKGDYEKARERAIKRMKKGFNLGGKMLSREEIHDRKTFR